MSSPTRVLSSPLLTEATRRRKRSSPAIILSSKKYKHLTSSVGVMEESDYESSVETVDTVDTLSLSQPCQPSESSPTKQSTKKKPPGRPSIYNQLLSALNDKNSPLLNALVNAVGEKVKAVVKSEMAVLNEKVSSLNEQITKKDETIDKLSTQVNDLSNRVQELEQYSRRNAVVLSGVKESPGENTDAIMLDVANRVLNIDLQPHEISRSHRIPGGPPRPDAHVNPRPIVIKFATYNIRKRVYDARRQLMSTHSSSEKLYINEHLTRERSRLFYSARQKVKDKTLLNAWTSDGRILVRDNNNKVHKIACEDDLHQFTHSSGATVQSN